MALGLPLPDEDERVRAGASPMAATTGGSAAARVIPCSGTYLEYDFNKHVLALELRGHSETKLLLLLLSTL